MPALPELQRSAPTLALWHRFDPKIKADLFSALFTSAGAVLVDPIPIPRSMLDPLLNRHPILGIVVTNDNHWRAPVPRQRTCSPHLRASL